MNSMNVVKKLVSVVVVAGFLAVGTFMLFSNRNDVTSKQVNTPSNQFDDLPLGVSKIFELPKYHEDFVISPDLESVAYILREGNSYCVYLNSVRQKCYGYVQGLRFSPKNELWYIAETIRDSHQQFLVGNGAEGKVYANITPPIFNQTGSAWVSVATTYSGSLKQKKNYLIKNGDETALPYNSVSSLRISQKGDVAALIGDFSALVINGKVRATHDIIFIFALSPDGERFAYAAQDKSENGSRTSRWSAFLDGNRIGGPYGEIGEFIFSHNSDKLAYTALSIEKRKWVVIVNEKEIGQYDLVTGSVSIASSEAPMSFSPDDSKFLYFATNDKTKGERYLFINGEQSSEPLASGFKIVFSPNNKHAVYIAESLPSRRSGDLNDSPQRKFFFVLDGKKSKEYEYFSAVQFSSDSKKIIYAFEDKGNIMRVVEPVE